MHSVDHSYQTLDQLAAEDVLEKAQLVDRAYVLTLEFSKHDWFTFLPLAFPIKPLHSDERDKRLWVMKHEAPESVFRLAALPVLAS